MFRWEKKSSVVGQKNSPVREDDEKMVENVALLARRFRGRVGGGERIQIKKVGMYV